VVKKIIERINTDENILEMVDIDKRFQGVDALKSCSINLKRRWHYYAKGYIKHHLTGVT